MNETMFGFLIQPPAGGEKSANAFCVMGDTFADLISDKNGQTMNGKILTIVQVTAQSFWENR